MVGTCGGFDCLLFVIHLLHMLCASLQGNEACCVPRAFATNRLRPLPLHELLQTIVNTHFQLACFARRFFEPVRIVWYDSLGTGVLRGTKKITGAFLSASMQAVSSTPENEKLDALHRVATQCPSVTHRCLTVLVTFFHASGVGSTTRAPRQLSTGSTNLGFEKHVKQQRTISTHVSTSCSHALTWKGCSCPPRWSHLPYNSATQISFRIPGGSSLDNPSRQK